MGEGVDGELAFDFASASSAGQGLGVFGGELAFEEGDLDFLEGLGFGEFALGEVFVEFVHEEGGGGVVDEPEGGHDGFGSAFEEVVTHSGDFESFGVHAAFSSFAGAEDDEVSSGEVFHAFDVWDAEFFAVAEEDEGFVGVAGEEAAVGGDVEDAVVGDVGDEGFFGEVFVEEFESWVDADRIF